MPAPLLEVKQLRKLFPIQKGFARRVVGHVRAVAPRFEQRIRALSGHPLVGDVRSIGLVGAVELVADKATRRMFDPVGSVAAAVRDACERRGLIVRAVPAGDSLAFSPPLVITEDEIDQIFDRFTAALDDVEQSRT